MPQQRDILDRAERLIATDSKAPICQHFCGWSIEEYLSLYLSDLAPYPSLQARLPKMPPEQVQRALTWFSGSENTAINVAFSRITKETYESTGRRLSNATVLDYGAGWGRLTRMMLQFVPGNRVMACDANPATVDLFNTLNFETRCVQMPVAPVDLPFAPASFDVIWLWSILTHLPEHIADTVMRALHKIIKPDGLLLVTVWPKSFWTTNPLVSGQPGEDMAAVHDKIGFAHQPQSPHWGNTTMSVDYLTRKWPQWKLVRVHDKVTQVMVYLRPSA